MSRSQHNGNEIKFLRTKPALSCQGSDTLQVPPELPPISLNNKTIFSTFIESHQQIQFQSQCSPTFIIMKKLNSPH